jgi:hypothetical protein
MHQVQKAWLVCAVWLAAVLAACGTGKSPQGASSDPTVTSSRNYVPLVLTGEQYVTQQAAYSAAVEAADGSFRLTPAGATQAAAPQFTTTSIERGTARQDFGIAGAVPDGQGGVGTGRGSVLERVQALPQGLELSWTFPVAPTGSGDALVRVKVTGLALSSGSAKESLLADARGVQIRVGQAVWVDAAGKTTAVDQSFVDGILTFRVSEALLANSRYPAVLDPVVSPASIGQVAFDAGVADGTIKGLTVGRFGPGSITSDDAALNCGTTCTASYTNDSFVTLTATPDAGAYFIGWSGLCWGTKTCTVSMSQSRFVYAYFEPGSWPVNVVKVGGGAGTVTGMGISCPASSGLCTVQVPNTWPRTSVSFSATPDSSSLFTGWSGVCDTDPCTFFVDRPRSAYATFVTSNFPLTVATTGTGTGTISGGAIQCASGSTSGCSTAVANTTPATQVTLTAAPTGSSIFGGWSWPCSGLSPTCTLTLDTAKSVTASFLSGSFPLSVSVSGAGHVTGGGIDCTSFSTSGCSVTVANQVPAPQVTLTATADNGALFAGWSGTCIRNGNQCTVTVDRASSISAIFQSSKVQLAVATTGHGAGIVTGAGINCTSGSTPGCSTLVDVMSPPKQVTLHAVPDASSVFTGWSGPCGGTGDCNVSMDAPKTAIASFAPRSFSVTIQLSGAGGTVTGPNGFTCTSSLGCTLPVANTSPAQQVVLTASPSTGFIGWSGNGSGSGTTYTLTVDDNKNIYANWQGTSSSGGGGGGLFLIGGTVTGLTGSGLTLRNNGGDDLVVTSSGSFAFATRLATGANYNVTVAQEPTGQTCVVLNGTGTVASADVGNVAVQCSDNATQATFSVSVNPISATQMELWWVGSPGATQYKAFDSLGNAIASGSYSSSQYGYGSNPQLFVDVSGLTPGTYHCFQVAELDGGGNMVGLSNFGCNSMPLAGPYAIAESMPVAHWGPRAIVLQSGKVLATWDGLTTAALYDEALGAFVPTGDMMAVIRPTITLLMNGKVLITGGEPITSAYNTSVAEIYDPATGTFSYAGNMVKPRGSHQATLLQDGRVLITGGGDGVSGVLQSAEIYDPATGQFQSTGNMAVARNGHAATLLGDGRVLITGGWTGTAVVASAEVYDPAAGQFTAVADMVEPLTQHSALLLPDGRVFLAGGNTDSNGHSSYYPQYFNPTTNTFSNGSQFGFYAGGSAALLPSGLVLIGQGSYWTLYDPVIQDSWSFGPSLVTHQFGASAVLPSGRLLLAGGFSYDNSTYYASAELLQPPTALPWPRFDSVILGTGMIQLQAPVRAAGTYTFLRSTSASGPFTSIGQAQFSTSQLQSWGKFSSGFQDTALVNGTAYWYEVAFTDSSGTVYSSPVGPLVPSNG